MPKIIGNPVGVPNPKTNWNQTDETKADVVLNKPTKLSEFANDVGYVTTHDISGKADKGTTLAEYGITDAISINREVYEDEIDSLFSYGGMRLFKVIGSKSGLAYEDFTPYYLFEITESKVVYGDNTVWQYRVSDGIIKYRIGKHPSYIGFDGNEISWGEWKEYITNERVEYIQEDINTLEQIKADKTEVEADLLNLEGSIESNTLHIVDNTSQINEINYKIFSMEGNIYGISSDIVMITNTLHELNSVKADKTTIITDESSTSYTFDFSDMYNKEMRLQAASSISIKFADNEYANDYISGLSFNSGETPTSFDYADSGIINWVGTDCATVDGLSIFQPSANTHYDIVFYFNGVQFIGLVNGFVPALGNEVTA